MGVSKVERRVDRFPQRSRFELHVSGEEPEVDEVFYPRIGSGVLECERMQLLRDMRFRGIDGVFERFNSGEREKVGPDNRHRPEYESIRQRQVEVKRSSKGLPASWA